MQYVVSLLVAYFFYFLITRLKFYNILVMFVLCFVFLFSTLCILCFSIVLCIVSPLVLSLPYFSQVYRPLPPGGNPIALNKHNVLSCHVNLDNTVPRFYQSLSCLTIRMLDPLKPKISPRAKTFNIPQFYVLPTQCI